MEIVYKVFAASRLESNITDYERLNNIKTFVFSNPFTMSGKSQSPDITEQYNRKTILTTEHCFPFIKTRIKIDKAKTREVVLTPIEVSIADIEDKAAKLAAAVKGASITLIHLSLVGIVGSAVNGGPLMVAQQFLRLPNLQIPLKMLSMKDYLAQLGTIFSPEVRETYPLEFRLKLIESLKQLTTHATHGKELLRADFKKRNDEKEKDSYYHLSNRYLMDKLVLRILYTYF